MDDTLDRQAKQARRFLKRNEHKLLPAVFATLPLSEQKNLTKRYVWAQRILVKWRRKSL